MSARVWVPVGLHTQVSFAMSAWGEFAFVVAEAAGGQLGIMDKDTQASVFLAVLISVIVAPSCVRRWKP